MWSAEQPSHSAAAAGALPFIGTPGWEHALVVGMRIRGGGFGLVAVGGPDEGVGTTARWNAWTWLRF